MSKKQNSGFLREYKAVEDFLSQSNYQIMNKAKQTTNVNVQRDGELKEENNIIQSNLDDSKPNKPHFFTKYYKQLKDYGFPDLGNFEVNENDKAKFINFFDILVSKKNYETELRNNFKATNKTLSDELANAHNDINRLEKEIIEISNKNKALTKELKDDQGKYNKIKENYEKQLNDLKSLNTKLNNKNNLLIVERKNFEEKYQKIAESYQKLINGGKMQKAQNSIEMIELMKKNDIIKVLSRISGTDKLIQLLKEGFNETVRELIYEISALKNFIFEINNEMLKFINEKTQSKGKNLIENFMDMPFLDTIYKIKNCLFTNLGLILQRNSNEYNNRTEFEEEEIQNKSKFLDISEISHQNKKIEVNLNQSTQLNNEKNNQTNSRVIFEQNLPDEDNESDYNELEILKKKWIETLMGKSQN